MSYHREFKGDVSLDIIGKFAYKILKYLESHRVLVIL